MEVGQQFSNYILDEKIGEGGFGDVFRARDLRTGMVVAIKCSHEIEESKRKIREQRFLREISCSAKLNNPRIVHLYDYGILPDGTLFLVMEYISGITLEALMHRDGMLPYAFSSDVILQILDALSEAHRQGIVHRDLKPSNIMLSKTPNNGVLVKILDFGIAKTFDGTEPDLTRQQFEPGIGFGTPQYMPPEQFFGKQLGPHSDLYAVGLVFLEMLTGQPAVTGATITEIIEKQIKVFPTIPDPFGQGPLGDVFRRALAKSVSLRYESAFEMYSDIDAITRHRSPFLPLYSNVASHQEATVLTQDAEYSYIETRGNTRIDKNPEYSGGYNTSQPSEDSNSADDISGFSTIVYEQSDLDSMANSGQNKLSRSYLESLPTDDFERVNPSYIVSTPPRFPGQIPPQNPGQIPPQNPGMMPPQNPGMMPPPVPGLMSSGNPNDVTMVQPEIYNDSETSATMLRPMDSVQMIGGDRIVDGRRIDDNAEMDIKTCALMAPDNLEEMYEEAQADEMNEAFYQRPTQFFDEHEIAQIKDEDISRSWFSNLLYNISQTRLIQWIADSRGWQWLCDTKEDISIFINTLYESHFVGLVIAVCLTIGLLSLIVLLVIID